MIFLWIVAAWLAVAVTAALLLGPHLRRNRERHQHTGDSLMDHPSERILCPEHHERGCVVGVEIRGVYDGVLYWQCMRDPSTRWHRWADGSALHAKAARYVDAAVNA